MFGTDTIMSLLMASTRSVNSWDLVVRKEGGMIVFDKRPDSKIDFLSVNENWNEVQISEKEHFNHPSNLASEATCIAQNLSQQLLDKEIDSTDDLWELDEPNPFAEKAAKGMIPASVGYRYRLFNLADTIKLVVRTEVSGFLTRSGERELLHIRAVNEFDSSLSGKVDWRQKLETQSSAVLTTEMKNNSHRLMKYAAQLELAGVDHLRLGFVSRIHPRDHLHHSILLAQRYTSAQQFAQTIGIELKTMWGNLREIIRTIQKLDDGKYILLKEATKPAVTIYRVPPNSFASIGAGVVASVAPPPKPAETGAESAAGAPQPVAAASAASAAAPAPKASEKKDSKKEASDAKAKK